MELYILININRWLLGAYNSGLINTESKNASPHGPLVVYANILLLKLRK